MTYVVARLHTVLASIPALPLLMRNSPLNVIASLPGGADWAVAIDANSGHAYNVILQCYNYARVCTMNLNGFTTFVVLNIMQCRDAVCKFLFANCQSMNTNLLSCAHSRSLRSCILDCTTRAMVLCKNSKRYLLRALLFSVRFNVTLVSPSLECWHE